MRAIRRYRPNMEPGPRERIEVEEWALDVMPAKLAFCREERHRYAYARVVME
jgi:hypothetical protein